MTILRTPEDRFAGLPDYPFAPHYIDIDAGPLGMVRQHYVDEGPRDGPVVLMMHGEPSWSYLYRHMIGPVAAAGFRVVVPDLIGFGKSDKPVDRDVFSYARHVAWLTQFLDRLELRNIGLFCQDWGGLLSLRVVGLDPDRFRWVIASNTFLPLGGTPAPAFLAWREFAATSDSFAIGPILQRATVRTLSDAEVAAYDAPFPDESYKAAARAFPLLVPISRDDPGAIDNAAAWAGLERFERPFLTLFGDSDPITAGGDAYFQAKVPGTRGQPHAIVERAAHFCQEDRPDVFVEAIKALG
ncbi:alpha/beta fold hydrolase [Sphingomonas sp. SFZ2018-12]|uniref:haloalkane dehalogenase n=1 Tax=Sphingomonas sp. SFZ2018-12 TaxID=2683197 RepID=UPI001F0E0E75|nr:haloalkane dehalogenase [Sphingomonas sp. SFZ2018-12]MCH4893195.1 alpha/beta fold hydrolase [Sphingomonas sp. SFZ2018-12]